MSSRSNIGSIAIATLLFVVGVSAVAATVDAKPAASPSIEPTNRWLDSVKARHKQFFDSPNVDGGVALIHILNYYDTYNKAYGVKDSDIDAVMTFYGATTFYGLNDTAWAKYRLGEFLNVKDASGQFVTANPWRANPTIVGMSLPQASIEGLKKRGATFILCNNALGFFANMVAARHGLDPKAVHDDMKANLLPAVELIPAMVIAVEQAQRAGLTYQRQ